MAHHPPSGLAASVAPASFFPSFSSIPSLSLYRRRYFFFYSTHTYSISAMPNKTASPYYQTSLFVFAYLRSGEK
ncbi:hypothetical protein M431DRAFT_280387 [Trichoderma harzianum CBS 226.95]|uniref:Uncharacterized protein n=1 Tax=Trichoderma harzianum CBS 226.95 TaxID=983964 RepID=A0A2T4AN99_TRIHA|nr:hypothetical protein M431DRAFT_280387 [Trichoderma harzianum CBS 226.95]PTB58556.1 hypothetical protein M431DRAFT_280387 [Trichoderma harzianum CBS 226.95]